MDFKYPYTDYHELNLDWFLSEFKNLVDTWARTQQDWISMQEYIRNYFKNLNVQTEIDNKINAMILDGTFGAIVEPFVTAALPAMVAGQLPDIVAAQIGSVVADQIGAVVAGQLPAIAAAAAAAEVGDWLAAHIDPDTGYVIDDSLTVLNAAADANMVGDILNLVKSKIEDLESICIDQSVNLFNKDMTFTQGLCKDGSVDTSDPSIYHTDYIELYGSNTYSIALIPIYGAAKTPTYNTSNAMECYDADKTFISNITITSDAERTFILPLNAEYIRFNMKIGSGGLDWNIIKNRTMLVKGSTIPADFSAYSRSSVDENISDLDNRVTVLEDFANRDYVEADYAVLHKWPVVNPTVITDVVYVVGNDTPTSIPDFNTSQYTVEAGEVYKITTTLPGNNNYGVAQFYDSDGHYLSVQGRGLGEVTDYMVTVPDNAVLMRTCYQNNKTTIYRKLVKETVNFTDGFTYIPKIRYTWIDADTIVIASHYSEDKDIIFKIGKRGPNSIVDFIGIYTVENTYAYITDLITGSSLIGLNTDWHSPYIVKAINNIDGDMPESEDYTGGNHSYQNTSVGDPTGRTSDFKAYVKNREVSGSDVCDEITLQWTNFVQATNTKKSDGTGREVLKEIITMTYDGERWTSSTKIIPLEDITIKTWYFLQFSGITINDYKYINFIGGVNLNKYTFNGISQYYSGNAKPNAVIAYDDNKSIQLSIDREYDAGQGTYYSGTAGMHTSPAGKAYAYGISNTDFEENNIIEMIGEYKLKPLSV